MENPDPAVRRASPLHWFLALVLLAAAFVPIVLWPSEVSWCIDEPRLLANAWHANHDHELANTGLYGNFAVPYGPVPTQIYQVLLAISHDPGTIVLMRGLLSAGLTAFALLWLARTLDLPPWFAAAFLLAPYVSIQQRILWDASFTIPFGALALAAFAAFLKTGGRWPLRVALFAACLIVVIHPQSIPLGIPMIGFVLWKRRAALRADARGLLWTAALFLALHIRYFIVAFGALMWRLTHAPLSTYPKGPPHAQAALAPLLGGNLFQGRDLLVPDVPAWLAAGAAWASGIIYALIWAGLAVALWRAPRVWRRWRKGETPAPRDAVSTVALACLVVQALLYGGLRIPAGPQYFFGTFALHAFLAWLGVDALWRFRPLRGWAALPGMAYLGAAAFLAYGSALSNHVHALDVPSWPTMKNAAQVVRTLNQYPDLGAWSDVDYLNNGEPGKGIDFKRFPQILRTLRLLIPADPAAQKQAPGGLFITFHRENGKATGLLEVQELGGRPPPPGAYFFDTSPLPKYWDPDPEYW